MLTTLLLVAITYTQQRAADTLVINDVTVLSMDGTAALAHRSVVIVGDRIVAIRSADAARPSGTVIDGRGKYLLPGLADMHVHLTTVDELPMFIGYGVLTVRDVNGSPETLQWKTATASGTIVGPRIFASGPMIAGDEIPWRNKATPKTAADAESVVVAQHRAGYDLIKLYDGISKDVFDASLDAAARLGMLSTGHIPASVGFDGVIASSMTGLEHLDKTVFAVMGHNFDTLAIPGIVDRIKRSGKWVTPTLESMIQLSVMATGKFDSLMRRPEARSAPKDLRDFWTTISSRLAGRRTLPAGQKYNAMCEIQLRLARALARAGVPLLAGTDLPNAVLVPGASLIDELDALVEAGLTREQALHAAIDAPARYFKQSSDWGTVVVGRRANLVLVDANPLESFDPLRSPAGVVLSGRWIDRTALARLRHPPTGN